MALPVVVIVGRPNVGKSSLLNALLRRRLSIVDPRAGITRDRVSAVLEHAGRYFEIVDTGGIGIIDADHLEAHVEAQIRYALERADLILFVVDAQAGVTPLDEHVAGLLRPIERPTLLVANKVDAPRHESDALEFTRLGLGNPICVSAAHGRGAFEPPEEPEMKLAIVGKRNAGKSTLVNRLAGEPRMIVSEIPGTTRDAVDVRFERDGRAFVAIDTAGVRKKKSMTDIDFYSYTRALASIRRADVVALLIDATVPVAEVDLKLAAAILEEHKPVVVVINKWDLVGDRATAGDYDRYLAQVMPFVGHAPVVMISARTGKNVGKLIDVALDLHTQARTRVPTGQLNAALQEIVQLRGPTAKRGTKPVKLYYATQVAVAPPTIVLFCNDPQRVSEPYRRFIENRLRERLPFAEVPMRLLFRPRRGEQAQTA